MKKLLLKLIWHCRGPQTAKIILKKKNNVGGLTLPHFETYYKATVTKIFCCAGKEGNTGVNLHEQGLGSRHLDTTPKTQQSKGEIGHCQNKNFCAAKVNYQSEKTTHRRGGNFCEVIYLVRV